MKKLSIIIPVYNVAEYLEHCIESIIQQKISDYEIIVINDGSTDNSGVICDRLSRKYRDIKVIHKSNEGVSSARNVGISMATAEYILFIDPDDYLIADSLAPVLMQINNKSDILVYRSYEVSDGIIQKEFPTFNQDLCNKIYDGQSLFINGVYARCAVWSSLFKTSFIKSHNLTFIEGMVNGEDSVFMAFAFMCNPKVQIYNLPLYCVNVRPGSASREWNTRRVDKMVDNIQLLDNKRIAHDELNNALIDYLIYNNISCTFDYINHSTMPICELVKTCQAINTRLNGRKLRTSPIKKAKKNIVVLNASVYLFALIKSIINFFRK